VGLRNPLKRLGVAVVAGPSMSPTLSDGDAVVIRYGAMVRPGAVVVLRHPLRPELLVIKRAVQRRPGGRWWVLGDNPFNESGDSTEYGAVPAELVLGRAFLRIRPRAVQQRSLRARLAWAVSALRPLRADVAASARLRSR
jgi:nickel-type superoxide dismutase maturation protease